MQHKDIKKYFNACNPEKSFPPSDYRYVDIDNYIIDGKKPDVRGKSWADDIATKIELSDEAICEYFTGYAGSGKTTVLKNICVKLAAENFYPIYIDGLEFLDMNHPIEIVEIYTVLVLNASKGVAELLGEDKDKYLNERAFFKRVFDFLVKTDVRLEKIELGAGGVKFVADVKENRALREQIRQVLIDNFSTFKKDVFQELSRLNEIVKEKRSEGIVIIFDSLEKNKGLSSNFEEVLQSSEQLFKNKENLRLPVHVVYTLQTLKRYELDEYFLQISKNREIIKLLNSIDLSEGFLLDIIFTKNIKNAHIIKLFLQESIKTEKIILPLEHPTTYKQYIEYFFQPLQQNMDATKIQKSVFIFDLTFLDKDDLYDTERFLIKLNEFRNNLANEIDRPVVMIIPQELKELFITFAQDTWSIRTITATVSLDIQKGMHPKH